MLKSVFKAVAVAAFFCVGCGCGSNGGGATTFKLNISANPKNGGTMSPDGVIKYSVGADAEITATPNEGYKFIGWSGASTATDKSVTIKMNSNQTLTANFEKITVVFGTLTDSRDGKKYRTVKIGDQTWMAENLNYDIPNVTLDVCYENNADNCAKYGRLYNGNVAITACPTGWHLPKNAEWNTLMAYVGGQSMAGKELKSKTGWQNNGNGTDYYGFSALPAGGGHTDGDFYNIGTSSEWLSGSKEYFWEVYDYTDEMTRGEGSSDGLLRPVRCVQD